MKPVNFPEANLNIAKDQEEYITLPSFINEDGEIITCFRLSEHDIKVLSETKVFWHYQLTFKKPMQPINFMLESPFKDKALKVDKKVISSGLHDIAVERTEQLLKHGYDDIKDDELKSGQLLVAAAVALFNTNNLACSFDGFSEKMNAKTEIERLTVAGALIAAEIDRLKRL